MVIGRWPLVLTAWLVVTVSIRWLAPAWNDVAYDGDFDYLPSEMSSVAAGQLLEEAFPGVRTRSQIVLAVGRDDEDLKEDDDLVALDLLRRLYHQMGASFWQKAINLGYEEGPIEKAGQAASALMSAKDAFDRAIKIDEQYHKRIADRIPRTKQNLYEPRLVIAYWDRGNLLQKLDDKDPTVFDNDFEFALALAENTPKLAVPIQDRALEPFHSLMGIMSWNDSIIGARLKNERAMLIVLQLSSELTATSNIKTIESIQGMIAQTRSYNRQYIEKGTKVAVTGSAAIGGETLIAARDAIKYTEVISLVMILLILAVVYRSPLLIAIPIASIGIAVLVATSLVALLTSWSINGTVPGLDLRVFTTSRIFVIVILFGAGTDYCLFLISRLREEAHKSPWPVACKNALAGVTGALMGSALTTIVGLGMLWIASFGKFHYTGPVIAICLGVGLLICVTLTPALLRAIGPKVFWPAKIEQAQPNLTLLGDSAVGKSGTMGGGIWAWIALMLTRRPLLTLTLGFVILMIPGVYGFINENKVTYDLSSQLSDSASSRQGLRFLSKNFEIGDFNPVSILITREEKTEHEQFEKEIHELAKELYALDGIAAVRHSTDPLGDFRPGEKVGLFRGDAWRKRVLQNLNIAQDHFFSTNPDYTDTLARLDVVMPGDPFSPETAELVSKLDKFLEQKSLDSESAWHNSKALLEGTTPSIRDLRTVTIKDNRRIKIAVVLAVFAVLVIVIRRAGLCLYLILTVLLSYYATLGLTIWFFSGAYGSEFVGLDWKLPLFLFVILVAVGQDYNVYLVTRVLEEQRTLGWLIALRRAVSRTGGIITACGLVMAATFLSMTSSAWLPSLTGSEQIGLRGIIQLGFALGLGVLIDTFYVRTILVPSFIAFVGKRGANANKES